MRGDWKLKAIYENSVVYLVYAYTLLTTFQSQRPKGSFLHPLNGQLITRLSNLTSVISRCSVRL